MAPCDYTYVVPGIFDRLEDAKDWDYQAQAWVRDRVGGVGGGGKAAGYNYAADVIGATLFLKNHATDVAKDLLEASLGGRVVRYIGHSNGCRIAALALELFPALHVPELHWLAPAVKKNCKAPVGWFGEAGGNGLNAAAARGQIGRLVLYVSPDDEILGIPAISFGSLGKDGPENMSPELIAVTEIVQRNCRHSDWVGRDFEATMRLVTGATS